MSSEIHKLINNIEINCRDCGEFYIPNPRLNDGYCDDCRKELNSDIAKTEQGQANQSANFAHEVLGEPY